MREFVIPFALTIVDGAETIVFPFDAARGPEYRCVECREVVTFRRAGHDKKTKLPMRSQHFAHIGAPGGGGCGGGAGESWMHNTAKHLVAQAVRGYQAGNGKQPVFVHECVCGTTKRVPVEVVDETTVEHQFADGLVADVFLRRGETGGAVEVLHGHPIGPEKVRAYARLAWWAEIDSASVLSGGLEWEVARASWTAACAGCAAAAAERQAAENRRADARRPTEPHGDRTRHEAAQEQQSASVRSGPLGPKELAAANARARTLFSPKEGAVIREPSDNVIGRFKILRRTDGLFVVHDTTAWPPNGPVFEQEQEARSWAHASPTKAFRSNSTQRSTSRE
jgi:hypothetical protein